MYCKGFILKEAKVKDSQCPEYFEYGVLLPHMVLDNGEEIPMKRVENFSIKANVCEDRGSPKLELVLNEIDIDDDFVIKKGQIFYKGEIIEFDIKGEDKCK